jgi:hypothetical protein
MEAQPALFSVIGSRAEMFRGARDLTQKFVTYFRRHSGQAGAISAFARRRDPESRKVKKIWIPSAFAGLMYEAL